MNRHNFLGHLALATAFILMAAFVGQVRRWQNDSKIHREPAVVSQPGPTSISVARDGAEVLVKFKSGTTLDFIRGIARSHNDEVEDEIESVDGLAVIRDGDGLDAREVASEYSELSSVEYAEPNYIIDLEDPAAGRIFHGDELRNAPLASNVFGDLPNDP